MSWRKLYIAIENNELEQVAKLLDVDPSTDSNYAIELACKKGHLEIVELLLQDSRVNPGDLDSRSIRIASLNGHLHVVERLLQDSRVDPSALDNNALMSASHNGHLKVLDRLLQDKRVNPSAGSNWALTSAHSNGHIDIVDRLLQDARVDSMTGIMPNFDNIQMIKTRTCEVCIGLQDMALPALLTLEIVDALIPNSIAMYAKWNLICKVKHFKG